MKVSLIISTYNWPWALDLCLKSIYRQTEKPIEILIADDGSGRATAMALFKYRKRSNDIPLKRIRQQDLGFRPAASRNNAIREAKGDYIIFLDHDLIVHPKFIEDHIRFAKPGYFVGGSRVTTKSSVIDYLLLTEKSKISLFSPHVKNHLNGFRLPFLNYFIKGNTDSIRRFRSANMAVWRKDLLDIDGFDEQFEGWGHEDIDLAQRLFNKGIKRKNVKFAAIAHHLYHPEEDRAKDQHNINLWIESKEKRKIKGKYGITRRKYPDEEIICM